MRKCTTCGRFSWIQHEPHTCPPMWRAWDLSYEEEPDNATKVYADDGESAAEEYVETLEEVRDGDTFTIGVRQGDGPIERYTVTASLTWTYSAERVEDEPDDEEPARELVEPLLGMPRYLWRGAHESRIEVDGRRPGGVIARFVILGNWHEVELAADRFDGEPCATMDDLERMVLRDLEEIDGVRPTSLSLRPLEVPHG